jgi:hypothetical protein
MALHDSPDFLIKRRIYGLRGRAPGFSGEFIYPRTISPRAREIHVPTRAAVAPFVLGRPALPGDATAYADLPAPAVSTVAAREPVY